MIEIDVAPELLAKVEKTFSSGIQNNKRLQAAATQINAGKGTSVRSARYAEEIGKELSKAFQSVLTEDALPNGRLYYNIADRVVRPMLERGCKDVQEMAGKVISQLNEKAGIGLTAAYPGVNQDRIKGIVDAASSQETAAESMKYLGEPVVNVMEHANDDMTRHNCNFQYKSGLRPKLIRHAESHCCDWCSDLAGEYDYPVKDRDVYKRHEFCRCVVEFVPVRGGRKQDVWSKRWKDEGAVEARKEAAATEPKIDTESLKRANLDVELPEGVTDVTKEYLQNATPGVGNQQKRDGFRDKNGEEKTANKLQIMLGGDIELLPENNNPDYLWKQKLWDLKSPTSGSWNTLDGHVRKGLKQIKSNAGGLIFDLTNISTSQRDATEMIIQSASGRARQTIDVIVIAGDNMKIFRIKR